MDDATAVSWLRLSRLERLPHQTKLALIEALGSPAAVFDASHVRSWRGWPGNPRVACNAAWPGRAGST